VSLQVRDELSHRLLGHLGASSEFADVRSVAIDEGEDVAMRRTDGRMSALGYAPSSRSSGTCTG